MTFIYCIVYNVPPSFHSVDLRFFFSDFAENKKFVLFHYLHRKQWKKGPSKTKTPSVPCFGIAKFVSNEIANQFIRKYDKVEWVNHKGAHQLGFLCMVQKIRTTDSDPSLDINDASNPHPKMSTEVPTKFLPKQQKRQVVKRINNGLTFDKLKSEAVSSQDIEDRFEELSPPRGLPQGNVGTPIAEIKKQIQNCTLPTSALKKLVPFLLLHYAYLQGINLSNVRQYRKYGEVPYKYNGGSVTQGEEGEETETAAPKWRIIPEKTEERPESDSDSDHEAEDWERHEALHPGEHEEYKYEEEIDKKWEKGGSGLVFYTDALYWEEGTKDAEDEVQDLWIDEEEHKEVPVFDKKKKKREEKKRKAEEKSGSIGEFEKYTRGIAGRIMRKSGWKSGKGLGSNEQGISAPLSLPFQNTKRGLGYEKVEKDHRFEERVEEMAPLATIASIYDDLKTYPDKLRKDFVEEMSNLAQKQTDLG